MKKEFPVKQLSNSCVKTYIQCPFSWKAKYILKFKMPSNEHFALGKAVHSASEFQIRFNLKRDKNLPLHVVLEKYQEVAKAEAYKLNKYALKTFREMYPVGHDLVEQFYFYLVKRKPLVVEKYFKVDMGYGIPMIGYMDLIFPDHALRDTKTASKPWPKSKLENEMQFTIYNEAYKLEYGQYPNTLGTIELDKTIIKTDKSQNAIREQLTHRSESSKKKLDLVVEKMIKGVTDEDFRRCGKRSCWACSSM